MREKKIDVIICTERGNLELQSKLLVLSIRMLGGDLSKVPIFSYQPRKGLGVSDETREFFEAYDVMVVDEPLNTKYLHYPLANKPLVCAYHEKNSSADFLLFLDSDMLLLGGISLTELFAGVDVLVAPANYAKMSTDVSFSKGEAEFWLKVYHLLGVQRRYEIMTLLDCKAVLEYYNSGVVGVKASVGLFGSWLRNFEMVVNKKFIPKQGAYFIEQSVLSATIAQLDLRVGLLDKRHNFPANTYLKRWRGCYPFSFEDAVLIHYHKALSDGAARSRLISKLMRQKRTRLLTQKICELLDI